MDFAMELCSLASLADDSYSSLKTFYAGVDTPGENRQTYVTPATLHVRTGMPVPSPKTSLDGPFSLMGSLICLAVRL